MTALHTPSNARSHHPHPHPRHRQRHRHRQLHPSSRLSSSLSTTQCRYSYCAFSHPFVPPTVSPWVSLLSSSHFTGGPHIRPCENSSFMRNPLYTTSSTSIRITHRGETNKTAKLGRRVSLTMVEKRSLNNNNGNDDDDDDDMTVSRRVFLVGTTLSSLFTLSISYRFFLGEDVGTALTRGVATLFPGLVSNKDNDLDSAASEALRVDEAFGREYYDAFGRVAVDQKLFGSVRELRAEEDALRMRSQRFFGLEDEDVEDENKGTNVRWYNFVLYVRLRTICEVSSPLQRVALSRAVAKQTLPLLLIEPNKIDPRDSDRWLREIHTLLQRLVSLNWISHYSLNNGDDTFDRAAWLSSRTATLTLFAYDAVPIQACQLIAEESYEEAAPKISPWIESFLTSTCDVQVSKEDYYLDDTYRPDPAQYRPTVLATQFDLSWRPA